MQFIARAFNTGRLVRIAIENQWIAQLEPVTQETGLEDKWPWVGPGLVDVQVNGFGGQEFSSPDLTVEKVVEIALAMDGFGLSRFCPTVTTNRREIIEHALHTIARACREHEEVAERVAGIHLEGPYISSQEGARGAHPLAYCRAPDWEEFQEFQKAAEGRIRILTLSPEYEGSLEFIRGVAGTGVVVSLGHTAASPEQIHAAAEAGARMSTHLGNGCHPVLPRHRNYLWAQLADDRLTAGLIGDGFHLPGDVVKCILRAKTLARCVLVSDLSGMAGLPPGRYATNLCDVEILPTGKLVMAGQEELLAGATAPVGQGVAHVMRFADLTLEEAMGLASAGPLRVLGMEPVRLAPGNLANLVLFDLETEPRQNGEESAVVQFGQNGGLDKDALDKQNADSPKGDPSKKQPSSGRLSTKMPQETKPTTPSQTGFHVRTTILAGQVVFGTLP